MVKKFALCVLTRIHKRRNTFILKHTIIMSASQYDYTTRHPGEMKPHMLGLRLNAWPAHSKYPDRPFNTTDNVQTRILRDPVVEEKRDRKEEERQEAFTYYQENYTAKME